jgi:hypothetical protein
LKEKVGKENFPDAAHHTFFQRKKVGKESFPDAAHTTTGSFLQAKEKTSKESFPPLS